MAIVLVLLVALLAFANGSNDNSKGVATLVGFGAARPGQALVFATLATAAGGVVSYFLGSAMLTAFSGRSLFHDGISLTTSFYVAALIGACGWVLIANKTGMPVSTTHAIVGALCGAGLTPHLQWGTIYSKIAIPLAISPILSLAIVYAVSWPVLTAGKWFAGRRSVNETSRSSTDPQAATTAGTSPAANAFHWFTCGLTSFARGWNDTPKIAALSLLALNHYSHGTTIGFGVVIVAMGAGGLLMGRKVLDTLSKKLTPLPLAESLTASAVTAFLVAFASAWSAFPGRTPLPVSTTHVATGSIIGAGLRSDPAGVKWGKVGEVALSWVITLPVAAVIAAVARLILR